VGVEAFVSPTHGRGREKFGVKGEAPKAGH